MWGNLNCKFISVSYLQRGGAIAIFQPSIHDHERGINLRLGRIISTKSQCLMSSKNLKEKFPNLRESSKTAN